MSTTNTESRSNVDQIEQEESQPSASVLTWRTLDTAHSRLASELSTTLQRQYNLSLNAHAVLAQLVKAPDRKLRMTEIANLIDFSLSGLTGLVGRLERDGLIERQSNFADRRVIYARLTDAGERYAHEANARYQQSLDALIGERLTPAEQETLTELLRRITPSDERMNGRR